MIFVRSRFANLFNLGKMCARFALEWLRLSPFISRKQRMRPFRSIPPVIRGVVKFAASAVWLAVVVFAIAGLPAPVAHAQAAQPAKVFKAGAATSNITPWPGISINGGMADRPAEDIHDELHARALVLDDGSTQIALVVCDSCMIPREVLDEAKQAVHDRVSSLTPDRILVSATHAHSAPTSAAVFQSYPDPRYQAFLAERIADAVVRAVKHLEPAQIGWGVGSVPQHVNNRRWKMKPGTITPGPFLNSKDQVRMNPPAGSPDLIEPAGPTDPKVSFVSVKSLAGRQISLLANYSLHYVGGTGGNEISADYFGEFADRLQKLLDADRLDPPFVGMMTNGTSGDINNINFRTPQPRKGPYEQIRLVADDVAKEVVRALKTVEYRDWVELDMRQATLICGVRKPRSEEIDDAKQVVAAAKGEQLHGLREVYAGETLAMAEYPDEVELVLQAVRIGELGIAAIPCEVFVEIGLELQQASPLKPTFTISLANGYNGYLPTPEHHALGGYETWRAKSSYLETGASPKIVATLKKLFEETKPAGGEGR